ncbi:MAG: AzlD domain-containing protein [Gaiellaceae bacterium]
MTAVWVTIGVLAVATAVLKLAGPLLLGGRPLRPGAMSVVELLASALLAALVVVETFGNGRGLTIDARVVGVAFAAVLLLRRAPMVVVVLGAAAATALTRLLVGG